jgi:pimeloyl-ACP methyl ester carboxylesterase
MLKQFTLTYTQPGDVFDMPMSIDLAIHPGTTDRMLLIRPGVDGSVDGYQGKYKTIAEQINQKYGTTVIRMSNPLNFAHDHTRNFYEVMDYIEEHYDTTRLKLDLVGHSLGGYVIGALAYAYDFVDKILMINPAISLDREDFKSLSERDASLNHVLIGSNDPSHKYRDEFAKYAQVHIIEGADHYFSGDYLNEFIGAPNKYLYEGGQ